MRRCYLSKNYKDVNSGGNKAKTDVEKIMDKLGFVNIGLKQTQHRSKIKGYLITLAGVLKAAFSLKKGDILVIQYPFKKYYSFICKATHIRGGKVVTLIHDLGSFRRRRLSTKQEHKRLANTDYIVALSPEMKEWLANNEYKQPIGILKVWDYLSDEEPKEKNFQDHAEILYVGALNTKRHSFMYAFDKIMKPDNYSFSIYGGGFDLGLTDHKEQFNNIGFMPSDDIISSATGNFGLVWYGHSMHEIDGAYGEWLKLTIPHKFSLYIRCHMPVIVWASSAQASFVKEYKVGFCINSLEDLNDKLTSLSSEEYEEMKSNVIRLCAQLKEGYYFTQAYLEAEKYFLADQFHS